MDDVNLFLNAKFKSQGIVYDINVEIDEGERKQTKELTLKELIDQLNNEKSDLRSASSFKVTIYVNYKEPVKTNEKTERSKAPRNGDGIAGGKKRRSKKSK